MDWSTCVGFVVNVVEGRWYSHLPNADMITDASLFLEWLLPLLRDFIEQMFHHPATDILVATRHKPYSDGRRAAIVDPSLDEGILRFVLTVPGLRLRNNAERRAFSHHLEKSFPFARADGLIDTRAYTRNSVLPLVGCGLTPEGIDVLSEEHLRSFCWLHDDGRRFMKQLVWRTSVPTDPHMAKRVCDTFKRITGMDAPAGVVEEACEDRYSLYLDGPCLHGANHAFSLIHVRDVLRYGCSCSTGTIPLGPLQYKPFSIPTDIQREGDRVPRYDVAEIRSRLGVRSGITVIDRSQYAAGKTTAVVSLICETIAKRQSVVYMSNLRATTFSMVSKIINPELIRRGLPPMVYDEGRDDVAGVPALVVCSESAFKVKGAYNIVIMDEAESILQQATSEESLKRGTFEHLVRVCKDAGILFMLDSDADARSYRFARGALHHTVLVVDTPGAQHYKGRKAVIHAAFDSKGKHVSFWALKAISDIVASGKTVHIPCSSVRDAHDVFQWLTQHGTTQIAFATGQSSQAGKTEYVRDFTDPLSMTKVFINSPLVGPAISNTTCTTVCALIRNHTHSMFAMGQGMMRARGFEELHLFPMDKSFLMSNIPRPCSTEQLRMLTGETPWRLPAEGALLSPLYTLDDAFVDLGYPQARIGHYNVGGRWEYWMGRHSEFRDVLDELRAMCLVEARNRHRQAIPFLQSVIERLGMHLEWDVKVPDLEEIKEHNKACDSMKLEQLVQAFTKQMTFIRDLDTSRRDLFWCCSRALMHKFVGADAEELRAAVLRATRDPDAASELSACVPVDMPGSHADSESDEMVVFLSRLKPFVEPLLWFGGRIIQRLASEVHDTLVSYRSDTKLKLCKLREWQKLFRGCYRESVTTRTGPHDLKKNAEHIEYVRADTVLHDLTGAGVLGLHDREVEIAELDNKKRKLDVYINESHGRVPGATQCIRLKNALNNNVKFLDAEVKANDRHEATHYVFSLKPLSRLVDEMVQSNLQFFLSLKTVRALFFQTHSSKERPERKEALLLELCMPPL